MRVDLPPFVARARRIRITNLEPIANVFFGIGFLLIMAYVVPAMISGVAR